MKFYFTVFCLFIFISGQAQFKEFTFNCNLYNVSSCSPFKETTDRCIDGSVTTSNWKVSHGSPSVVLPNETWGVLKAKDVTSGATVTKTGEGLFTSYSFVKGKKYAIDISVLRADNNDGGQLWIKAANSISAGGTTACEEGSLPSVEQTGEILPLARSIGLTSSKRTLTAPEFRPTQNFNQLWVYAEEIFPNNSCEYQIEYITVTDLGWIDGTGPKPPTTGGGGECPVLLPTEPGAVKLTIPTSGQSLAFGYDMASYGDYLVVGTYYAEAVYVYKKEGCTFVHKATLTGDATSRYFGWAVDIYDDHIIVGAPSTNNIAGTGGKVFIFEKNGESWTLQEKLAGVSSFGYDVAIDEYNALVGSPQEFNKYGMVYFYKKFIDDWLLEIRLPGPEVNSSFGQSVDIKKNRAVVGAPGESNSVFVYDWKSVSGRLTWNFSLGYQSTGYDPAFKEPSNDFGLHLALNDAENEIIISGFFLTVIQLRQDGSFNSYRLAQRDDSSMNHEVSVHGNYLLAGCREWATLYEKNTSGSYDVVEYLDKDTYEDWSGYGYSVTISDNFMAVGAPAYYSKCVNPGSAYVYDIFGFLHRNTENLCNVYSTGKEDDMMGKSITIGGESCSAVYYQGASANYYGNMYVSLKPGFTAKSGSNFKASTQGCPFDNQYVYGRAANDPPVPTKIKSEPVTSSPIISKENPFKDSYLTVYPNPSKGNITAMSHSGEIEDLKIYDQQGNVIYHIELKDQTQKLLSIDLGEGRSGMFILQATVDGKQYVEKIIVR